MALQKVVRSHEFQLSIKEQLELGMQRWKGLGRRYRLETSYGENSLSNEFKEYAK